MIISVRLTWRRGSSVCGWTVLPGRCVALPCTRPSVGPETPSRTGNRSREPIVPPHLFTVDRTRRLKLPIGLVLIPAQNSPNLKGAAEVFSFKMKTRCSRRRQTSSGAAEVFSFKMKTRCSRRRQTSPRCRHLANSTKHTRRL